MLVILQKVHWIICVKYAGVFPPISQTCSLRYNYNNKEKVQRTATDLSKVAYTSEENVCMFFPNQEGKSHIGRCYKAFQGERKKWLSSILKQKNKF